ncbi:unnamed protein product [Peronospora destructor]|uniref:Cilia- and flagella-associated protein 157 n=1 Tax=Peronospora destructor TaxID=86335 RepID=A0AAV0USN5_9STRA|nr:unnamed protein product [Peronospora destructor]
MTSMPPPSEPSNKRKRKRQSRLKGLSTSSSCPPSSTSSLLVATQLETLENWHRALTIDLREVRREGSRIRKELEKVEDTVEAAVEKAERCALQAQQAQEHVLEVTQAKAKAVEETESQFQAAGARYETEIKTVNKRLTLLDKKLERYMQRSMNEELLMTHLTEFQEQYEHELRKVREDQETVLRAQKKHVKQMERRLMVKFGTEKNETKRMDKLERMVQTLRDENARLSQRVRQVATRQEMQVLQQQVEVTKKENQDEHGRTRLDLYSFKDRVGNIEKRVADTDHQVLEIVKAVEDVTALSTQAHPLPKPALSPRLPLDLVRQADLDGIHEVIRRINRDFQAVAVDFTSLAKKTEIRASQQEQHAEAKLKELSTQLFDALSHDSRLHAAGSSRLKDAIFDVQNEYGELDQRIKRLEDDVQQVTAACVQVRPPQDHGEGRGWRYRHNLPLLSTRWEPPMPATFRNCQERPSRYEPAPVTRKNLTPPHEPPHLAVFRGHRGGQLEAVVGVHPAINHGVLLEKILHTAILDRLHLLRMVVSVSMTANLVPEVTMKGMLQPMHPRNQ